VNLGLASVNASMQLQLPQDRWLLFAFGNGIGPAILFWGKLIVLMGLAWGIARSKRLPHPSYQWFLLALGLTQVSWWSSVLVMTWFFACQYRLEGKASLPRWLFNLRQVSLVVLTLIMLGVLFSAVQGGLLGWPDMQVIGNGSGARHLNWFFDRMTAESPVLWIISVPLMAYRVLMLLWALWLAWSLLRWLKWAWTAFVHQGFWREKALIEAEPEQKI